MTDPNAEIREHWAKVRAEFPNASTAQVTRKTAEDWGITSTRVLQAFGDAYGDETGASFDREAARTKALGIAPGETLRLDVDIDALASDER